MNLQSGAQNGLWIAVAVLVLIFLVLSILGMGTMAGAWAQSHAYTGQEHDRAGDDGRGGQGHLSLSGRDARLGHRLD